jgi:hypothetical protein
MVRASSPGAAGKVAMMLTRPLGAKARPGTARVWSSSISTPSAP